MTRSLKGALIIVSRGKKPKSNRSVFFKALMGKLAGDRGNSISDKFVKGDLDGFKADMEKIVEEIVQEAPKK